VFVLREGAAQGAERGAGGARAISLAPASDPGAELSATGPVRFLPCPGLGAGQVAAVEWSPCGRLLAGVLPGSAGIHVWDVAKGDGARVRPGRRCVRLVRWSPCGARLFVGLSGSAFVLLETGRWTQEFWQAERASGDVSGCAWAADGSTVAFSFEHNRHLACLAFIAPPPSLAAQLVPVTPKELSYGRGGGGGGDPHPNAVVGGIDWDPTGRRVAVLVQGNHPAAGQVALFSARGGPLLDLSFVGWVAPPAHPTDPARAVRFQAVSPTSRQAVLCVAQQSGRISSYPIFL